MKNEWTELDSINATKEGWDLYCCYGSCNGMLQVQRNDEQGILNNDEEAWAIVREGSKNHHIKAKKLLKSNNPTELERILNNY